MIDTTLIDTVKELVKKEKKINEFKRRLRIKGRILAKETSKKGNIRIIIKKDDKEYKFTVLKTHKECFSLAEKLQIGRSVSIEGIPTFRTRICTRLTPLNKGLAEGKQTRLERYG